MYFRGFLSQDGFFFGHEYNQAGLELIQNKALFKIIASFLEILKFVKAGTAWRKKDRALAKKTQLSQRRQRFFQSGID